MRNIFTTVHIVLAVLFATQSIAQEKAESNSGNAFGIGTKNLGFSIGFGLGYSYYANMTNLPAIAVTYDQGFKEGVGPGTIGLGGIVGYKGASYDYPTTVGSYKASWTNIIIAARGSYHLHVKNNKLDPYGGIMAGVRITSYKDTWFDSNPALINPNKYGGVFPAIGLFIGTKYNFSSKAGVFAELGYDVSLFRLGFALGL